MNSEPHPAASQRLESRPATVAPAPASEAIVVFAVLAAALAGCWLAYGQFIREMARFMAHAIFG